MARPRDARRRWDRLYRIAAAQEGLFTTRQAAGVRISSQVLHHHLGTGHLQRVMRGIYRLVHFPAGDHEELVAIWLWSDRQGVFSHGTALSLHQISDILPAHVDLTVPDAWRQRRLGIPEDVSLHFDDIDKSERTWVGAVPVTSPLRTLRDCAATHLSPELLEDAAEQAIERGLIGRRERTR